jgi:hypothetical protein
MGFALIPLKTFFRKNENRPESQQSIVELL